MIRLVVLGLVLLHLLGCGSAAPVPIDTFYRLPELAPDSGSRLTDGAVRVAVFAASDLHKDRAILFSDGARHEFKQHHYHFWIDSPANLLQLRLARYLRLSGAANTVITGPDFAAEYEINGRINAFERQVAGGNSSIRVGLEFQLKSGSDSPPLLVQEYVEERRVGSMRVADSVAAFGEATELIFKRFLADAVIAIEEQ